MTTNEKQIVKEKFDFLINNGFSRLEGFTSNVFFALDYAKEHIVISPSYDYRDQDFQVAIRDVNNKSITELSTNLFDTTIGIIKDREEFRQEINNIYKNVKKHTHGMPKKYFETIVTLHCEFVRKYINEIILWTYK